MKLIYSKEATTFLVAFWYILSSVIFSVKSSSLTVSFCISSHRLLAAKHFAPRCFVSILDLVIADVGDHCRILSGLLCFFVKCLLPLLFGVLFVLVLLFLVHVGVFGHLVVCVILVSLFRIFHLNSLKLEQLFLCFELLLAFASPNDALGEDNSNGYQDTADSCNGCRRAHLVAPILELIV